MVCCSVSQAQPSEYKKKSLTVYTDSAFMISGALSFLYMCWWTTGHGQWVARSLFITSRTEYPAVI